MNYDESYSSFKEYINKCIDIINNTYFTNLDGKGLLFSENDDINKIVTDYRLDMINGKKEHTLRMIERIKEVNDRMDFASKLQDIIKLAILFHDLGRFRQATWTNSFSDREYIDNNKPFKNHGEDGYDIFLNNDFKVYQKYIPAIGVSILHHLDHKTIKELNYKYDSDLTKINVDDILLGNFDLNNNEWHLTALITQLVADIDKLDILYQHLNSFEIVKPYIVDKSFKNLDEISKHWNIPKNEILNYNKIDELKYVPREIQIPVVNIPVEKLQLNDYYKKCFYENNWPSLSELKLRDDWNFVSALWWKFGVFLNQIEFYINLKAVDDNNLIAGIYNKIDDNYKVLFEELFEYSDEVLVKKRIKDNKGKIYL